MTHIIDNQQLIDYPMNLLEFQKMFHDETACLKYLERIRWPNGFVCSKCSHIGEPFRIENGYAYLNAEHVIMKALLPLVL